MRIGLIKFFFTSLFFLSFQASAQWAWHDANGRMVFSDLPPPASIKPNQIVKKPGSAASTAAEPAPGKDQAVAPPARAAAEAKGKSEKSATAEDAEHAAQKERDCERMRRYQRALESGQRIAIPDAQGNPVPLDDAARADEIAQVRKRLEKCTNG